MARMTGFIFQDEYLEKLVKLSDQELGRLIRALATYHATGKEQELAGRESIAYDFIKADIDRIDSQYQAKCETNKNNRSRPSTTVNDRQRTSTTDPKVEDKVNIIDREREEEENDNTRARVIREAWLAEIGKAPTPAVVNRLTAVTYGMDLEVIRLGIRMAALKDKPFEYLLALYPDWQSEHITTLSEADEYIMLQDGVKGKVPMMTAQDAMDRLREFRERATA